VSKENKSLNFFGKKETININIEEELSKSENIEYKKSQKDKENIININRSNIKNSKISSDKNNDIFNLLNNNESNDKYVDKKIKTLFSKKFDNTFANHKNKSFLTLMNFSIGVNYFLYKSNDFTIINEYINALDSKK
jgi:hypothetical protein